MAFLFRLFQVFLWYRLIGTIVHELAHLLVVILLPGVRAVDVDLTSHVKHEGRLTTFRAVCISFAPLLVNTALAVALFIIGVEFLTTEESLSRQLWGLAALVAAPSTCMAALPSKTDAISPFRVFPQEFPSLSMVVSLPVLVVYSVPAIFIIPFCALRERYRFAYIGTSAAYAGVVLSAAWVSFV